MMPVALNPSEFATHDVLWLIGLEYAKTGSLSGVPFKGSSNLKENIACHTKHAHATNIRGRGSDHDSESLKDAKNGGGGGALCIGEGRKQG